MFTFADMNITSVLRKLFIARQRELAHYTYEAEKLQHDVLMRLVGQAKDTEYGRKHLFAAIKGYDDFAKNVPVNTYEELKGDIKTTVGEPSREDIIAAAEAAAFNEG